MVTISIIVVFFRGRGLSMADVMILQAVFAAVVVIVEVPSGYFSDVVGRRRTMIIGACCIVMGWFCYLFVASLASFIVAEVILALGISFVSGTDAAILYDTMLELDNAHESIRAEGRRLSVGNFSEAAASVVGGALAGISVMLPFYVQAGVALLLIPLAAMLVEPTVHGQHHRPTSIRDILHVVRDVVVHNRELRWIIITSSLLGSATLTMVWLVQPWWGAAGIPLEWFGVLWAVLNAVVGISAIRAHSVERRFGALVPIGFLAASVVLGYVVLGLWQTVLTLPLMAVFYVTRGISNPIFNTEINERVSSDRRATVLSVRQLGVRAVFVVAGPLVGWCMDTRDLATAMVVTAVVFGAALIVAVWRWKCAVRVSVA